MSNQKRELLLVRKKLIENVIIILKFGVEFLVQEQQREEGNMT